MNQKIKMVEWALDANVYEVNVRQYTPEGTFAAFRTHLPRLKEMGIDILWFMPLTPISKAGRKGTLGSYYACSSYVTINPEFGTLKDFKQLVGAAHQLGFKIVIDWVANHTGHDHEWTQSNPDFYKRNNEGEFYDAHGWNDVIDLDYTNPQLWKAMTDAMKFWVTECDIDGFRCDMAHLVSLDFWAHARKAADDCKKLLWIAETEAASFHSVFDVTYGWELLHSMEKRYQNTVTVWQVADVLIKYETFFPEDGLRLLFTSNHDENSHSGSESERLGDGAKAFAVLCATWKNSLPLIYSGQEIPNTKRLEFFEKDEIAWTDDQALHEFYKTLLQLRKKHTALSAGGKTNKSRILSHSAPFEVLAFTQKNENDEVLVLLNLTPNDCSVQLYDYATTGLIEAFTEKVFSNTELFLKAWGYQVFVSSV